MKVVGGLVVGLGLALTACGSIQSGNSSASGNADLSSGAQPTLPSGQMCVLSVSDAATALNGDTANFLGDASNTPGDMTCSYFFGSASASSHRYLFIKSETKDDFQGLRQSTVRTIVPLSGIGEDAYMAIDNSGTGKALFSKSGKYFEVQVEISGATGAKQQELLKSVAKLVASKA